MDSFIKKLKRLLASLNNKILPSSWLTEVLTEKIMTNWIFLKLVIKVSLRNYFELCSQSHRTTKVVKPFCVIEKVVKCIHTHLEHKPHLLTFDTLWNLCFQSFSFCLTIVEKFFCEIFWMFSSALWVCGNLRIDSIGLLECCGVIKKIRNLADADLTPKYSNLINPLTPLYTPQSAFRFILLHPD